MKKITLDYDEYISVYKDNFELLNPLKVQIRPCHMLWEKLGLDYHDSISGNKRVFKVLDEKKWMHYWMLMKIKG